MLLTLNYHTGLFRVLHDAERGPLWRLNLPEVFFMEGANGETHLTEFTEKWQYLSFDLFRTGASSLTDEDAKGRWRSLYMYNRAFTNKHGFEDPDNPCADYVNKVDLSSGLPAFDKVRMCGGATIKGTVEGDMVRVETLNGEADPPDLQWLLNRPWFYFHATTVREDGIGKFPQGRGEPVYVPLLSRHSKGAMYYPLKYLEPLQFGTIADPYEV